jgi:murein DD-endopeptidase MepM/ murein hydrolase activator NlpD
MHYGVDIKAKLGTPVVAPMEGRVIDVDWNRERNGHCIKIRGWPRGDDQMVDMVYLHLMPYDIYDMQKGRLVRQGETIGRVGYSGDAHGAHLHYEILINNTHANPEEVYAKWKRK